MIAGTYGTANEQSWPSNILETFCLWLQTLISAVPGAQPLLYGAQLNYEFWKQRQEMRLETEEEIS